MKKLKKKKTRKVKNTSGLRDKNQKEMINQSRKPLAFNLLKKDKKVLTKKDRNFLNS